MILVLGATGYVGSAVCRVLQSAAVMTLKLRNDDFDEQEFIRTLLFNKVDVVINCAGYTGKPNVDACEQLDQKQPCLEANAFLPARISRICSQLYIKMVHVSSGCIYTSNACDLALPPDVEYTEQHLPNFGYMNNTSSWYSRTKALGEKLIDDQAIVLRLRIPFDDAVSDRNYLCKLRNYDVLYNATNSFSQLQEFAHGVAYAALENVPAGIYNLTQPGYMTTMQVVEMMRKYNIISGNKLFFKNKEDFNKAVKAPRSNCVLDSTKALRAGFKLTPIEDAMQLAIDRLAYNLTKP